MAKMKFPFLAALNFLFIFLAYGRPVEIKGALSWVLWLAAFGVTAYCIKSGKKFLRAFFVFQLIIFIIAVCLFRIREYGGRALYSSHREGNILTEVYQINPGAMGHYSVQRREYYCIVNGELLSVRILLSQETKHGSLAP